MFSRAKIKQICVFRVITQKKLGRIGSDFFYFLFIHFFLINAVFSVNDT